MVSMNNISTPVSNYARKGINSLTSNENKVGQYFTKVFDNAREKPAQFAANMAVMSVVTKDAVGCYYYVTQSLKNEKIPEDKRGFVASLDLMNGILMVTSQFTIGKVINKYSPKWFDGIFGNKIKESKNIELTEKAKEFISEENIKKLKEGSKGYKLAQEMKKNFIDSNKFTPEQLNTYLDEHFASVFKKDLNGKMGKWLKIGFSTASALVATTILTKRVLVPLVSTPLAGWFNKTYLDKPKDGEIKSVDMKKHIPLDQKLAATELKNTQVQKAQAGFKAKGLFV